MNKLQIGRKVWAITKYNTLFEGVITKIEQYSDDPALVHITNYKPIERTIQVDEWEIIYDKGEAVSRCIDYLNGKISLLQAYISKLEREEI